MKGLKFMKKNTKPQKVQFSTSLDNDILKAIKIEAIKKNVDAADIILSLFGIEPEPKIKKKSKFKARYKCKNRTPFCSKYNQEHIDTMKQIATSKKTDVSKVIEELWNDYVDKTTSSSQNPLEH